MNKARLRNAPRTQPVQHVRESFAMIDSSTIRWFMSLPAIVIDVPGVLRIQLTPYTEQVAAVIEANRYRDRRRVKRELRKMHERMAA